jgi:hypothetical protein
MTKYHHYAERIFEHYITGRCDEECPPGCPVEHEAEPVHVHTDAELRARDEAMIRAAYDYAMSTGYNHIIGREVDHFDAIITAAEREAAQ